MDLGTRHRAVHTAAGVPSTRQPSIVPYLGLRARTHGDAPFLTAVSRRGEPTTITYRQLDFLTSRIAARLSRELDLVPGEVVAVLPVNDASSVVGLLSLLRAGCAVLVLSPTDPVARLDEQVRARAATRVLRSPEVPDDVYPDAVTFPGIESVVEDEPTLTAAPEPLSDSLFFGTSGSTAASKLVAQSHRNIVANAESAGRHHDLRPGDVFLGCLPIHHVNGLHFTIFATLVNGTHAVLAHAFDPLRYPKLLERFRPRIASVVPTILEALLETWRNPSLPVGFDYFVSAAAPLTAVTARAVLDKWGARVLQGYGLTETTNFSTTMPTGLSDQEYRRLMVDVDTPSIGVSFDCNEVAVLDQDGRPVPPGGTGELCMRGSNVMNRYAGNAEATDEAFRHGWFHSQDLGVALEDAASGRTYFVITGRSKNIAKVGGESVSLDEMDRVLRAIPGVLDAACVRTPSRFLGEEIIAAVVLDQRVTEHEIRDHLRRSFAESVLPRRIARLDRLPRTSTGKIRRPDLAAYLTSER